MNRFFILILSLIVFVFQSCLDMFEEKPSNFVGKIYVLNSDGYTYLIYSDSDLDKGGYIYSRIVNENLVNALGNDSVILIKTKIQNNFNYYLVRHAGGNKVISVNNIDSLGFLKYVQGKIFKYSYQHNSE